MSTTKNQVLRYLFMIFPALAVITAKTFSDWLRPDKKNRAMAIMIGVIAATALFVNSTPFKANVTLADSTKEIRDLAAVINLNTPENERIGNFRLQPYNPRLTVLFYANRLVEFNVTSDANQIFSNPGKTWLTSIHELRKLTVQHPDKVYLIQANNQYAYITAMENRKNIRYDFSAMRLPVVK